VGGHRIGDRAHRLRHGVGVELHNMRQHDRVQNAVRDPGARSRCIARLAPTEKGPANALVYEYQLVVRGGSAAPVMA